MFLKGIKDGLLENIIQEVRKAHRCFPVNFVEFLRISFLRRTPLVADSESDAHPQTNNKALNVVIITKFSYNFAMKESWHDLVLQFMHILCYCDKQHQAKTICYFYKPEKYKFFCLSNLSKLSTCLFINKLYKQLDSINTESI